MKFHPNPCTTSWDVLFTDRQGWKYNLRPPLVAEVINKNKTFYLLNFFQNSDLIFMKQWGEWRQKYSVLCCKYKPQDLSRDDDAVWVWTGERGGGRWIQLSEEQHWLYNKVACCIAILEKGKMILKILPAWTGRYEMAFSYKTILSHPH